MNSSEVGNPTCRENEQKPGNVRKRRTIVYSPLIKNQLKDILVINERKYQRSTKSLVI